MSRTQIRLDIERLTDQVEAKFQYVRDLQGDPVVNPALLEVVNAHGAVLSEIVRYLRRLAAQVEELVPE